MAALHSAGATAVLVAIILVGAACALLALRGGSAWVERLRLGLTALIAAEAVLGAGTYLSGARPREPLHLLYGAAALALLPLAASFAEEAPPRPRAWVMAVACLVLLLLAWRLASTA